MFSNIALDVVMGLIFVYLLYSLFATILIEIIATKLGLRARNLKEAVDRMLNDEEAYQPSDRRSWLADKMVRIADSVSIMKNPKNKIIERFYNHPEIKYLGSTGIFRIPSSFQAVSFSKTLIYLLNRDGPVNKKNIDTELRNASNDIMGAETTSYVLSLWEDSHGDLEKFKLQLENWFNRSMEQATEWYKRKIQVLLLITGFFLAWIFNADSFVIIKKLSTDKTARDQMVAMATAYIESRKADTSEQQGVATTTGERMDSLLAVKQELEADIYKANTLLGIGSWPPDRIDVTIKDGERTYPKSIEPDLLPYDSTQKSENYSLKYNFIHKWCYFTNVLYKHFWGFLVTALAISLGSPFWFDLLNKVMRLRTSKKQATTTNSADDQPVSPLNREG